MSAPLKSFEGPDVEILLDQIRADVGPGAKINGAEKVRVGGVLGFFAKEHYRVVVEGPETAEDHDAPSPPHVSGSGTTADHESLPTPARAAGPADVFSAMADATDDVYDVAALPAVRSSPARQAHVAETPPVTRSFGAVLTRVATTLDGPAPTGRRNGHGNRSTTGPAVAHRPQTGVTAHDDIVMHDDMAAPVGIATKAAQFLNEVTPPPAEGSADDAVAVALRRVGLDPALVDTVSEGLRSGGGLETLLVETLATLTPAPAVPVRPGSLLVVVGAGAPARRLGAALADEMGIDPARIPLASLDPGAYALATGTLLLRSADDAAERAPGWRRSEAALVVVDAGVTNRERSWAAHLIAALRPTAVWGVVDSTSKTEDVAAWAEALGGVDALALENTDATVSPAAALGAGIAVARINGQPASAARWAATIVDRVPPCR